MRRKSILSIVITTIIFLTMVIGNASIYAKAETKRQIVVFDENVGNDKKTEILEKHKATKIKDIKGTNPVVVSVLLDNSISDESDVRLVEEDYIISIEGSTSKKAKDSDNNTSDQPAEVVPWGIEYMNDLTSDSSNTGTDIKIGIIDTGIDINHPDLFDNEIDIINMSIGMENESTLLHKSVIEAYNAGITMVAAAGNNYGGSSEYPASYDEVIGVRAINVDGDIAVNDVGVWAPGEGIYSTYPGGIYKTLNGTSMETPHYVLKMLLQD